MIRNHYNDALSRSDQDQNLHFPKNPPETVMSGYFFLKIWRRNVYQRSSCQLHLVGATWQNRLQVQYDDETGTSVWHSERARRSKGTVEGKGKALLPRTFFLYSRTRNCLARPHPFEPRGLYYVYYWQHCVAANWVKHLKRTGQNIQFKIKHK